MRLRIAPPIRYALSPQQSGTGRLANSKIVSVRLSRCCWSAVTDRRPKTWAACFGLLAALSALCACSPPSPVRNGKVDQYALRAIKEKVENARGLLFRRDVHIIDVTPTVVREKFVDNYIAEYGDKVKLKIAFEVGSLVGLNLLSDFKYSPNTLVEALEHSPPFTEVVAAEVSPDQVLITERGLEHSGEQTSFRFKLAGAMRHPIYFMTGRSRFSEFGFAEFGLEYALDLTLVDQHFGVTDKLGILTGNHDAQSALNYVRAGDALLTANMASPNSAYWTLPCNETHGLWKKLGSWWDAFASGPTSPGVEGEIEDELSLAETFVCEAYQRQQGWKMVNELYRNPPRSTQQILHPELYFNHPTRPLLITLSGYQGVLSGWTDIYEDTYGERSLHTILKNTVGEGSTSLDLAHRWAGDRVVGLQRGEQLSVLWLIAFRDVASASQFSGLYGRAQTLSAPERPVRVSARGNEALVAVGEAAREFSRLAPYIWKETKTEEQP